MHLQCESCIFTEFFESHWLADSPKLKSGIIKAEILLPLVCLSLFFPSPSQSWFSWFVLLEWLWLMWKCTSLDRFNKSFPIALFDRNVSFNLKYLPKTHIKRHQINCNAVWCFYWHNWLQHRGNQLSVKQISLETNWSFLTLEATPPHYSHVPLCPNGHCPGLSC